MTWRQVIDLPEPKPQVTEDRHVHGAPAHGHHRAAGGRFPRYLPPAPSAAADELRRRREETGVSYFVFGANVADTFAALVAELAGR